MTSTANNSFPYQLSDLVAWVVRKKDGTSVRYQFASPLPAMSQAAKTITPSTATDYYTGYKGASSWCNHNPASLPVYANEKVQLFIADAQGARAHHKEFDFCIDGGGVLTLTSSGPIPDLTGDKELVENLLKHQSNMKTKSVDPRILKIYWSDRQAPPVDPEFWPDLAARLSGKVLTICQGGHGRSGTALVALMMCYTDYTPLDAITHLRAIHCPRAIESVVQHRYLNEVATLLGREPDALDAEGVKDFRARFLSLDNPTSKPYQERLLALSKSADEVSRKDDPFCDTGLV